MIAYGFGELQDVFMGCFIISHEVWQWQCDRQVVAEKIMECDAGAFLDDEPECDNDCDA